MANGEFTREQALESDENFRQFVVIHLDRHSRWQENHERQHDSRDRTTKWAIGAVIALIAVVISAVGVLA